RDDTGSRAGVRRTRRRTLARPDAQSRAGIRRGPGRGGGRGARGSGLPAHAGGYRRGALCGVSRFSPFVSSSPSPFRPSPLYLPPYAPPPPPPPPGGSPPPPPPEQQYGGELSPPPENTERVTYGLVQLRGVPDGAAVDLDGRFWLTATGLDKRWLALPEGE